MKINSPALLRASATSIAFVSLSYLLNWVHRLQADEGVVLSGAWNLMHGRTIYRDFTTLASPGSFYFVAALLALFTSYEAALIGSLMLQLASVWAVYQIARILSRDTTIPFFAALSWLVMSSVGYWSLSYNSQSIYIGTFAVLIGMHLLQRPSIRTALLAGIVAGLTFFFLQTKGLALILALTVTPFLAKHQLRQCIVSLVTLWSSFLAMLCIGWMTWGPEMFIAPFQQTAQYVAAAHSGISYAPLSFTGIGIVVATLLLMVQKALDRSMWFLIVTQILLLGTVIALPDPQHLLINSFPLIIIAWVAFIKAARTAFSPMIRNLAVLCLIVTITSFALLRSIGNDFQTQRSMIIVALLKHLTQSERFFATPFMPNFYFELGIENPYYDDIMTSTIAPSDHIEKNLTILRHEDPPYVMTDYTLVSRYGHDRNNPLDTYIAEKYRPTAEIGRITLWTRKGSPTR